MRDALRDIALLKKRTISLALYRKRDIIHLFRSVIPLKMGKHAFSVRLAQYDA